MTFAELIEHVAALERRLSAYEDAARASVRERRGDPFEAIDRVARERITVPLNLYEPALADHSAQHLPGGSDELLSASPNYTVTGDSTNRTIQPGVTSLTDTQHVIATMLRDGHANKLYRVA